MVTMVVDECFEDLILLYCGKVHQEVPCTYHMYWLSQCCVNDIAILNDFPEVAYLLKASDIFF